MLPKTPEEFAELMRRDRTQAVRAAANLSADYAMRDNAFAHIVELHMGNVPLCCDLGDCELLAFYERLLSERYSGSPHVRVEYGPNGGHFVYLPDGDIFCEADVRQKFCEVTGRPASDIYHFTLGELYQKDGSPWRG